MFERVRTTPKTTSEDEKLSHSLSCLCCVCLHFYDYACLCVCDCACVWLSVSVCVQTAEQDICVTGVTSVGA